MHLLQAFELSKPFEERPRTCALLTCLNWLRREDSNLASNWVEREAARFGAVGVIVEIWHADVLHPSLVDVENFFLEISFDTGIEVVEGTTF